jgi:hypothetical protein
MYVIMDDSICFKLGNECLYSEQMLVEYNNDPVFYICKSQNDNYYVVLCLDVEVGEYTIINPNVRDILLMLYGKIPMRNLYNRVNLFWKVSVGKEIEEDIVTKHDIKDINKNILPYEGEYFIIYNQEIKDYVAKMENKYHISES